MLDHINWYLVELERKLRNKRSAQATTDMLVEAKSHLEEHAAELVAKGMDPATASKAAVADFGSPASVMQAYSGVAGTSNRTYLVLAALAAVLLSSLVVAVYVFIFNPLAMQTSTVWMTTVPWLSIPIVAWVGFRARRWIAVPIVSWSLLFGALAGIWATSKAEVVHIAGDSRMIYMPSVEREIELRRSWLTRANRDLALIQAWRASRNPDERSALLRKFALQGRGAVAPVRYGHVLWRVLPSDFDEQPKERFVSYFDDRLPRATFMGSFPELKFAEDVWKAEGDQYVAFLKRRIANTTKEMNALGSIQPQDWSEKWWTIGFAPIPIVGAASLMLLLLNGLAIGASSLLATSRRQRWRRQLG